jgi:RNA polymerase sigma-70 factor (ECF subfamily)
VLTVTANGQPALAEYLRDERGGFSAHGINVLTLEGGRVADIMAFLDASMFARFGLPDRVD